MAAILGDVRFDGWQFGDLMASWIPDAVARVQPVPAMATRLGDKIHGLIRTLGGNQRARMPGMSGLPTGLTSTLRAATAFALAAGKAIGGWRLRRGRRVLLPQGQLTFQVGDLFLCLRDLLRLFGDLPIAFGQFMAKPLNLVLQPLRSVLAARAFRPRHAPHGTPIRSICTAP